LSLAYSSNCC